MMQPMRECESPRPYLEYGFVTGVKDGVFAVSASYGSADAQRAMSCLVVPQNGDEVLLSRDQYGKCFILSILSREKEAGRSIDVVFPSSVCVRTEKGGISVAAPGEVILESDRRISMRSRDLSVHAHRGEASVESLSFLGGFLTARIQKLKMVGGTLETTVRRITQKAKSVFRTVEGHEEVRSDSARYTVSQTLHMRTGHSVHVAKGQMKLDADQIHLG